MRYNFIKYISAVTLLFVQFSCTAIMKDQHTNRLINETSPYLLQHAHNPVDWYPWGEEALEKAKSEDKLLLISIGYSACHWCHVMEHESFEDTVVAKIMNENFICIKVDREERPDVDQVYMDAVQLISGRGGWPLNSFALPDGRPVYGGTYYRKNEWKNLLGQISNIYANDRKKLTDQADAIQEGILKQENSLITDENKSITKNSIQEGILKMAEGFDKKLGAFNGAPKFPMPAIWDYLLDYVNIENKPQIKDQVLLTLDKMALGGIYDHVGGGFARYSVDAEWHAPHFEKMLYDNSQLVSIYSKAYKLTKNEHYKRVVYETLNFVKRELTSPENAFFSALDADSEGEEGKFYVWKSDELKDALGKDYPLLAKYYNIKENGNWEHGNNIFHAISSAEDFATENNISLNDFLSTLEMAESKLLLIRSKRIRPGLDDKILTSWNALMLKAYIDAYNVFENASFLEAALNNAKFIKNEMIKDDFSLHRTYKNKTSKINGFLDDYSFTIAAFIELYQATYDEKWLNTALHLTNYVVENFRDDKSDFLFYTSAKDKPLAIRKKEISDNVIPSSNSSMTENLLILSKYFGNTMFSDKALKMIQTVVYETQNYGRFYSNWGRILMQSEYKQNEIVITGTNALSLSTKLKKENLNNVIYAVSTENSKIPIFENRYVKDKTLIYICEDNSCKLPVTTTEEAIKLLRR